MVPCPFKAEISTTLQPSWGQFFNVDLISVFLYDVHHVDRNDHRDSQLCQLRGQVQITLQVCAVDDVQNSVGPLIDQIVSRYNLFQRIRRQGINTRKIRDGYIMMLFSLPSFFLHRNAGPVPYKLVRARQRVEQRRFTAVRIACKRNSYVWHFPFFLSHLISWN